LRVSRADRDANRGQPVDLPISVGGIYIHARGLRPHRLSLDTWRLRCPRSCLPHGLIASASRNRCDSAAQYPACMLPCQRFTPDLLDAA